MAMTLFPAFSHAGADNYERVNELFSRPFKYPSLKPEDIKAAIAYAAELSREKLVTVSSDRTLNRKNE
jgi:hypothetical protein